MSLSAQVGDAPRPRGGTHWALRAGVGVPLGLAALLDADIHDRSWPLVVFLAVGDGLAVDVHPARREMLFDAFDRQAGRNQAVDHPGVARGRFLVGHVVIVHRCTDGSSLFDTAR